MKLVALAYCVSINLAVSIDGFVFLREMWFAIIFLCSCQESSSFNIWRMIDGDFFVFLLVAPKQIVYSRVGRILMTRFEPSHGKMKHSFPLKTTSYIHLVDGQRESCGFHTCVFHKNILVGVCNSPTHPKIPLQHYKVITNRKLTLRKLWVFFSNLENSWSITVRKSIFQLISYMSFAILMYNTLLATFFGNEFKYHAMIMLLQRCPATYRGLDITSFWMLPLIKPVSFLALRATIIEWFQ